MFLFRRNKPSFHNSSQGLGVDQVAYHLPFQKVDKVNEQPSHSRSTTHATFLDFEERSLLKLLVSSQEPPNESYSPSRILSPSLKVSHIVGFSRCHLSLSCLNKHKPKPISQLVLINRRFFCQKSVLTRKTNTKARRDGLRSQKSAISSAPGRAALY